MQSFTYPASGSFSSGLALTPAGHVDRTKASFQYARDIAHAALTHKQDSGTPAFAVNPSFACKVLFTTEWLLNGIRSHEYLRQALGYLREAERRTSTDPLLQFDSTGYADMVQVLVLQGQGHDAVALLPKLGAASYQLPDLLKEKATRTKTLSLASQCLCNPALEDGPKVRERLRKGVEAVMRQEFSKPSPDSPVILLWLDLPGSVYGVHEDPWQLLASINNLADL